MKTIKTTTYHRRSDGRTDGRTNERPPKPMYLYFFQNKGEQTKLRVDIKTSYLTITNKKSIKNCQNGRKEISKVNEGK